MSTDKGSMKVLSAASFVLAVNQKRCAEFSKLGGIKSTMSEIAYNYSTMQEAISEASSSVR